MKPIRHLYRPFGPLAAGLVLALLVRGDAQAPAFAPTIAFIGAFAESEDDSFLAFRTALERAWPFDAQRPVLRFYQGSDDDAARRQLATKTAVSDRPSVIVAPSRDDLVAVRLHGTDVPVVFASFPDPVRQGLVDSARLPGRRTTGVALGDALDLKRLELLKETFPRVATVAMLADRSWLANRDTAVMIAEAWRRLGLRVIVRVADTAEAFDALMSSAEATACDAWYIPPTYVADLAGAKIITALKRLRLPTIHAEERAVAEGALMAYSQDTSFAYDALAHLTRRVALGEDAGTIPIQRPYRYTLSVRIEPDAPWARIDPSVIRRADRVHGP